MDISNTFIISKLDQKTYVLNTGLFLSIKLNVEAVKLETFFERSSIFIISYLNKFEDEKDEKYRKSNKLYTNNLFLRK